MAVSDFPKRLADTREDNDMTQSDLATASSVARSSIARYETGEMSPSGEALIKLAKALNTTCEYLMGEPVPEALNVAGFDTDDKQFLFGAAAHLRRKQQNK